MIYRCSLKTKALPCQAVEVTEMELLTKPAKIPGRVFGNSVQITEAEDWKPTAKK